MDYLTELLHKEWCSSQTPCARWRGPKGNGHRQYYEDAAERIYHQLEPEIGEANVFLAVRVIVEELG